MTSALLVDLVVAALLVATSVHCFVLNKRLKAVKDGQAQLAAALGRFDEATRAAQAGIARMESGGRTATRDLAAVSGRAGALLGELSVMVAAGDTIAARLEGAVGDVRALGRRAHRVGEFE
jgi:hypothetical protein